VAYSVTEVCVGCSACAEKCPARSITGEKGEVYTIDPKSCIECGVCGKICPKEAVLDSRGNVAHRMKPTAWPKPIFDKTVCVSCNMCIQICPVSCLALSEESARGACRYPYMENPALCIACGFCAEDCPVDAISMETDFSSKERS